MIKLNRLFNKSQHWQPFGELTLNEKVIVSCITFTFAFYAIGALYLVAPVIGWLLLAHLVTQWASKSESEKQNTRWLILLWIACAVILEIVLVIGHLDFNLSFSKIIKSTIGWAKGWALLSVFIVLGFSLQIRYQLICRAACIIGLIALLITPVIIFAYLVNLPSHLYVSPLKILGGAGDEFFTVILYEVDPFNGSPRWRFFAPWAPAVGLVANIYFMCAWFEKDKTWRVIGLIGNAAMITMAASRMGMIVLLLAPITVWGLSRLTRPWIMVSTAISILVLALLFEPITSHLVGLLEDIKGARADSTRVRAALGNIAFYRWSSEAYWFGHGVMESGTHLVEFMPIGSHHNWYGLLFVKGMIGLLAFAIPFGLTIIVLLIKAQYQVSSRLALGMCLIIAFFSLSENLEALAYMTWPAWLLIGIGLRSKLSDVDTNQGNLLSVFRLLSETPSARPALSA